MDRFLLDIKFSPTLTRNHMHFQLRWGESLEINVISIVQRRWLLLFQISSMIAFDEGILSLLSKKIRASLGSKC